MSFAARAGMPLLRRLDPETAHGFSLRALRCGLAGAAGEPDDPVLAVSAFGRRLSNPVGLAAGFDKNAVALAPLGRLGFGFLEAGTVTPRPQPGNSRPRLFRLREDGAVINRMGFNNHGIAAVLPRLAAADRRGVALGANIGINKDEAAPERDYPALAAAVAPHVDYVAVNVSSPNTPGLRDLQSAARLAEILDAIEVKAPLFVKISPDLPEAGLEAVLRVCLDKAVAGLIVSNTTLARPASLAGRHRGEAGGLSGAPLFTASTAMLARAHAWSAGRLTLIGVGGVFTARDALTKILAGATLVQVYTAFTYRGPGLPAELKTGLAALLKARGFQNVAAAVGAGG